MFIFSLVILSSSVKAFAAEEPPTPGLDGCLERAPDHQGIAACYKQAAIFWEEVLNNNYTEAKDECEKSIDVRQCSQSLLSAQKTWLAYRDSFAKSLYNFIDTEREIDVISSKFYYMATKTQALIFADIADIPY
jgi:uncharacterized protein YecT (DUF1311 family)